MFNDLQVTTLERHPLLVSNVNDVELQSLRDILLNVATEWISRILRNLKMSE